MVVVALFVNSIVEEPSNFSPAPDFFFRLRLNNIGSGFTQKIIGSGYE